MKRGAALAFVALAIAACAMGRDHHDRAPRVSSVRTGLVPAGPERAARGAPAVAVGPGGEVLVLDAVEGRVTRLAGRELVPLARVPKDADDLAVGPDGAFAIKRATKPEVVVYDASGAVVGRVDTSAVDDVSAISLARSRRVLVTTGFQETFDFGSPAMPQLPGAVLASKREGAATLADGRGVTAVRTERGQLELRIAGEEPMLLGRGDAARIVGASGAVVCARVERLVPGADEAVKVARAAVCVDAAQRREVFRTELPEPSTYLPRRELAFARTTLAFARATENGLDVTTWDVRGDR